ncbi:alpha/beta fold hydrolase [Tropicibacter oceani]|uniref:Alpha/beta hydrolase n=1 Tax=Tropicibacter oceani TaxID=3058420 RepID=A0ABY8QLE7_9RHOB|nr:alpha/beta hydrolase [Tropicibacter oceani]WGW04806.1 alpha/beta hydrolase [Tropicibacter oceani]
MTPKDMEQAPALHVRRLGTGPMAALALHCGLGTSGMWKGVAGSLDDSVTLTAPDFPGHGRSAPFRDQGDVHDQACDAVRGLFEPGMHLIGHSFGATVALRLALEHPGRAASVSLIEPVFFAAARGRDGFDAHRAREEAFFGVYQGGDMMQAAQVFHDIWGGGIPWDRFPSAVQKDMARGMPFVAATEPSLWADLHGLLAKGGLEALRCPVTLIRGAQTVPMIALVHGGLMDRLPNAREMVIDGAGHMLSVTHPDQVAQAILGTMRSAT